VLLVAQEDDAAAQRVIGRAVGAVDPAGGGPRRATLLVGVEDRKLLVRAPRGGARLVVDVWTAPVSKR